MPRNGALLIQDTMNYVYTSMNSTLYSAGHVLRAMSINTLVHRDHFIDKMDKDMSSTPKLKHYAAPVNTETLFVDELFTN